MSPSARPAAATVRYSARRHEVASATGPRIMSARAMPNGHADSMSPIAVCSSRSRNQPATMRASMMFTSTPPTPPTARPRAAVWRPPAYETTVPPTTIDRRPATTTRRLPKRCPRSPPGSAMTTPGSMNRPISRPTSADVSAKAGTRKGVSAAIDWNWKPSEARVRKMTPSMAQRALVASRRSVVAIGWLMSDLSRVSRTGIVLTLVTRNNESHLAYRSQSDNPLQGTTLGGWTDDPRGEGTRTAAACHPARGAARQCQPGLPGGRDLPGSVLSLAPAAGALRAGRRASPPASGPSGPAGAAGAGDGAPAAERGRERGDVGCQSDRGVLAAPLATAGRPQHRAAGVAPRGAGDPAPAAAGARAARRADGGAAHRADPACPLAEPARTAAACSRPRTRRAGVPGHLLHRPTQGGGQGLADHGLRCGLLVRGRLAAAHPHRRSGRPLPASDLAPGVSPRGLAAAPRADRWRARVQGSVR